LEEIQKRAQKLLRSSCQWTTPLDKQQLESLGLRHLKWLPTIDLHGVSTLRAADECRGLRDKLLVNSQLPIVDTFVTPDWRERLGWNEKLSSSILLAQLRQGIDMGEKEGRKFVDAVLDYIWQKELAEELASDLMGLPCVLASNSGTFVLSSHAFPPPYGTKNNYMRLQPYINNVERKFWQEHQDLLVC
jgi:sacsin